MTRQEINTVLLAGIILILVVDRIFPRKSSFHVHDAKLADEIVSECRHLPEIIKRFDLQSNTANTEENQKAVEDLILHLMSNPKHLSSLRATKSPWSQVVSLCIMTSGMAFLLNMAYSEYLAFKAMNERQGNENCEGKPNPITIEEFFKYR